MTSSEQERAASERTHTITARELEVSMTRENSNGRVETHLLTAKNQIFKPQTGTAAPAEQRRSHASGHASCVRPCVMRHTMAPTPVPRLLSVVCVHDSLQSVPRATLTFSKVTEPETFDTDKQTKLTEKC